MIIPKIYFFCIRTIRVIRGLKSEGSVIVVAFDFTEQPETLTIVSARIEHYQGSPPHDRLKVVEEVMA